MNSVEFGANSCFGNSVLRLNLGPKRVNSVEFCANSCVVNSVEFAANSCFGNSVFCCFHTVRRFYSTFKGVDR